VEVLHRVRDAEPMGITSISTELDYPEHQVRYSLRMLEPNDLVEPTEFGAVTTERTDSILHDFDRRISDLVGRLDHVRDEYAHTVR